MKDDNDVDRNNDKLKRKKNKLKNSEILESLQEEFGTAPEVGTRKQSHNRIL